MRRRLLLLLPAVLLAACGKPLPEVTPDLVARARSRWPDAAEPQLVRGREVFLARCNKCHDLPDPAHHDAKEWAYYLHEMSPRAQLADDEQREVLRFLVAAHDVLAADPR